MSNKVVEVIKNFLKDMKPMLGDLFKKIVIPAAKQKLYTIIDEYIEHCASDLASLADKYVNEASPEKKEQHRLGLQAGVEALSALAQKLLVICDTVKEVL